MKKIVILLSLLSLTGLLASCGSSKSSKSKCDGGTCPIKDLKIDDGIAKSLQYPY